MLPPTIANQVYTERRESVLVLVSELTHSLLVLLEILLEIRSDTNNSSIVFK